MEIRLDGRWMATPNVGLQARAGRPGYEPIGWTEVPVPGHWQQALSFANHQGPFLYRTQFDLSEPLLPEAVAEIRFDGVFARAKVWVNGTHLGEHEGYFAPAAFEVTRHLRLGENVVMVEVESPAEDDPNGREAVTGSFGPWEGRPGPLNPGGFAGPVRLLIHRDLVPGKLTLRSAPAEEGAAVDFAQEFTATAAGEVTWQVSITPETFDGPVITAGGAQAVRRGWNRLHAKLSVPEPRLWWTWDRGRPDLYRFRLELRHSSGQTVSAERLFGIRTVELQGGVLYLNGKRLFLRGAVQGPVDFRIAGVTLEDYRRDVALMRKANLNAVRAYGHVAGAAFYEEASRQGLLIWQDMPLQGLYRRSVLEEAKRQAEAMVDLLHSWPAVGFWCAHADPSAAPLQGGSRGWLAAASSAVATTLAEGWNRSALAGAVRGVIATADSTRPCIAHPGELGGPLSESGRGFLGWHEGKVEDLGHLLKSARLRMVTGFGAQAFPGPELQREIVRGEWPQIDWERLESQYGLQRRLLERNVPESLADSFATYTAATQWYQAHLYRYVIEHVRQRKYAPSPGIFAYTFAEGAPAVGFGVLDARREPKAAYEALAAAMRPVTISANWPPPAVGLGGRISLKVFLLNDTSETLTGAWGWRLERGGDVLIDEGQPASIPADGLVIPETGIEWTVPPGLAPGEAQLVLELTCEGHDSIETRYAFQVTSV